MPITLPDRRFRTMDLRLTTSQQTVASPYTGRRQVSTNPWLSRWRLSAEHVPIVGEAGMLPWRAFFAQLRGQEQTFRFVAVEADQHNYSGARLVQGDHAGGASSLLTSGWNVGETPLKAGQMVTINDQLIPLTADATIPNPVGEPGSHLLAFGVPLRAAAANGTAVETKLPTVLLALDDPEAGYSVGPGQQYGFSLVASEVFL